MEYAESHAVATLEEARVETGFQVEATSHDNLYAIADEMEQARTLPEAGGTVGPLPDGTVIEVKHVGLARMRIDCGVPEGFLTVAEIIHAYNDQSAN